MRVINHLKYRLIQTIFEPESRHAYVDVNERIVYFNQSAFANVRNNTVGRANWLMAHEVGHIRMHEEDIAAGLLSERLEREADAYAIIFQCPHKLVRRWIDVLGYCDAPPDKRPGIACRIASELSVRVSLATMRIKQVIELDGMPRPKPAVRKSSQKRGIQA